MHGRLAHDALLDVALAGLELRLDQRDQLGARRGQRQRRRQHVLERDEADVDGDDVGGIAEAGGIELANVGAFERHDLRPVAQARMQLVAADVDRVDPARAARQQHLGEAAGRGADVEADAAGDVEAEPVERMRELDAGARHPRERRLGADDRLGGDLRRRLGDRHVVGGHQPGGDGGLRLGAALEQAALDEQAIDTDAGRHDAEQLATFAGYFQTGR